MTYNEGEAAIIALIQALPSWDASNSISLANDDTQKGATLMNTGASDRYCFAYPGAFTSSWDDIGGTTVTDEWITIVRVIAIRKTGPDPRNILATERQAIKNALDAHYHLGDATKFSDAKLTGGSEIIDDGFGDVTRFVEQELFVTWREIVSVEQQD